MAERCSALHSPRGWPVSSLPCWFPLSVDFLLKSFRGPPMSVVFRESGTKAAGSLKQPAGKTVRRPEDRTRSKDAATNQCSLQKGGDSRKEFLWSLIQTCRRRVGLTCSCNPPLSSANPLLVYHPVRRLLPRLTTARVWLFQCS